jgi:hypothetical protein
VKFSSAPVRTNSFLPEASGRPACVPTGNSIGGPQVFQQGPVFGLAKEEYKAFGDDRSDILNSAKLLLAGRGQGVRPLYRSARVRAVFSPTCRMPRAKIKPLASRPFDFSISSIRLPALFVPSAPGRTAFRREVLEVGDRGDELFFDELIDERLSQAFDVHRPAAGEMQERFAQLGRAGRVLATGDSLALRR